MSTPLPGSYRWAVVAAALLGFQVAVVASFDVHEAFDDQPPPLTGTEATFPQELGLSPLAQRQVMLSAVSGYRSALLGMLPWRPATSVLLALASGLVCILGLRLRFSEEGRGATARRLGLAALGAAMLRSIDGAENLVLWRAGIDEMGKVLVREGAKDAQALAEVASLSASVVSGGWTLLVVAGFVTLGSYFRSETLRAALGRAEP